MAQIHDALNKAISVKGAEILCHKRELCIVLEDLIPDLCAERAFLEMIYNDELGKLFYQCRYALPEQKDGYIRKVNDYLRDVRGLEQVKCQQFMNMFCGILYAKPGKVQNYEMTGKVKSYKDYMSVLTAMKKEYDGNIPPEIIRLFVEKNRLFSRFSITTDDVISDLASINV